LGFPKSAAMTSAGAGPGVAGRIGWVLSATGCSARWRGGSGAGWLSKRRAVAAAPTTAAAAATVAASRNAERKPWPMAHPFDPSSIAVEACNSGYIAVSRVQVARIMGEAVRNATPTA
jgi:hypothetical protein